MTPLATYLMKQVLARPKDRENIWRDETNIKNLRGALNDIHCFEVSECSPLLKELSDVFETQAEEKSEELFARYSFLPAPKTWVEWRHGTGNRIAVLLEQPTLAHVLQVPTEWASATFFCDMVACRLGRVSTNSGDWYDEGGEGRAMPTYITDVGGNKSAGALLAYAHSMLLLINTPRIIGRKQHLASSGLERRLVKQLGVGRFPLHAWTEIKLQVTKPVEIDDGEPHEAHLTGRRALHFCRKHIRIRLGRLEYVNAHWRGDPAIGIKRSRYVVTP